MLGIMGGLGCLILWAAISGLPFSRHRLSLEQTPILVDKKTEARIVAFCGDCHTVPQPNSFPRHLWHDEVRLGYEFYARSGRRDLDPPPMYLTTEYFRSRAPEEWVFPEPQDAQAELRATFTVDKLDWGNQDYVLPAIAHVQATRGPSSNSDHLIICDMRDGSVSSVELRNRNPQRRVLARLNNPCHAMPCDLDEDGATDLLVADLGSFYPDDHERGRVVWLRQETTEAFSELVIASGLGRVADARPMDVDADGDLDVIVAEFGHSRTGNILLLKNVALVGERPRFERRELDPRSGTICVPLADFNGDGRQDFVALIGQEYESVDLFVNQGNSRFHTHHLWSAPDLTFGSSSMEVVDLDQDGDIDILFANGDAFDNSYASPSHGVQWLENLGGLQFAYHRLTDMPGAQCVHAGDIDLDRDLDILVVAHLPSQVMPMQLREPSLASIVCLEQTSPRTFARHTLETGLPRHPTFDMDDFDADGDLDFAVGSHVFAAGSASKDARAPPRLAIWWNKIISEKK
jgi:hypothetical protein